MVPHYGITHGILQPQLVGAFGVGKFSICVFSATGTYYYYSRILINILLSNHSLHFNHVAFSLFIGYTLSAIAGFVIRLVKGIDR